ncbi:hypothetical protein [Streptosporangium sp. NBC_01756]|uniref:hypothetical protein n=1 Tax=Streptosporangium sp. NBC_01756 TaxID=2975950 RepID=UPI002DDB65A1|nr:hypothetical protein [Streptosporangium sp. NBC_01756]WSC88246.1 hypothetical protein OIE48_08690 [Streptosporangium sp. NBC_01756]
MDVSAIAAAVAMIAGTGAVTGLGEKAALTLVETIRARIRSVFGADARSVDALEQAQEQPEDDGRIKELAAALAWHAQRDPQFAAELAGWAEKYASPGSVTQQMIAGRDIYAAGRDMTVHQRPEIS